MSMSAHLESLKTKHETLDNQIQSELRHPAPDNLRLAELKKQKLQIKDTLSNFMAENDA